MEEIEVKQDGNAVLSIKWLIGGLATAIFTAGTSWLAHVDSEIGKIKDQQVEKSAEMASVKTDMTNSVRRLDRIENKIDLILDKIPNRK